MSFTFVDLFSGIGGFHAALGSLGGQCVYASEIDKDAARIYQRNWGLRPDGDITLAANDEVMNVPEHDVLVGGFPCQPFSKSGYQRGMDEARGTLFWNIAKIIEIRKPKIVILENVRNLAGPRHKHEWDVIIATLRQLGYRVSSLPFVVSPHKFHPEFGGRPQVRERVFICATRSGKKGRLLGEDPGLPDIDQFCQGWAPSKWNLAKHLPLEQGMTKVEKSLLKLKKEESDWIEAWESFVQIFRGEGRNMSIPGFPIWVDSWVELRDLVIPPGTPNWKANFLRKNSQFYTENKRALNAWLRKYDHLKSFPPSRRKFEWQAQDAKSLNETIMHFRPSGIRAKKSTYVPALVAITQTSILGKQNRRISIREGARLQGLPDWFDFLDQPNSLSYKQLGNGVNVSAVYNVMKALVIRDLDLLKDSEELVHSVLSSDSSPDSHLRTYPMPTLSQSASEMISKKVSKKVKGA